MSDLSEKVATMGFTIDSVFKGVVLKDGWQAFAWEVTVSRGSQSETIEYFTGSGNRTPVCKPKDERKTRTGEIYVFINIARERWIPLAEAVKMRKVVPTKPELADVLYSMYCPEAIDEDFESWAPSFGYSNDSIKAQNIYLACQKLERQLRRLLGSEYEETMSLDH